MSYEFPFGNETINSIINNFYYKSSLIPLFCFECCYYVYYKLSTKQWFKHKIVFCLLIILTIFKYFTLNISFTSGVILSNKLIYVRYMINCIILGHLQTLIFEWNIQYNENEFLNCLLFSAGLYTLCHEYSCRA